MHQRSMEFSAAFSGYREHSVQDLIGNFWRRGRFPVLFFVLVVFGSLVNGQFTGMFQVNLKNGVWGIIHCFAWIFGIVGWFAALSALFLYAVARLEGHEEYLVRSSRVTLMLHGSVITGIVAVGLLGASLGLRVVDLWNPRLHMATLVTTAALQLLMLVWVAYPIAAASRFLHTQARTQSEAKLALLQSQLNPHFLFNALNTVAALVRTDAKAAEVAVEDVARVLRRTLDRSQRSLAPLAEEVDYLKAYLAIEEQRWGERLRVMWEIRPDTLELLVPPLCLQPLVENALKHGLSEKLGGGTVTIGAAIQDRRLSLWTRDDGIGLGKNWREGTGLSNLRERLVSLYGGEASLYLRDAEPGTWAVVTLPLAPHS